MPSPLIDLKVLLPFAVFLEMGGVSRIVAETRSGSFGLLPHRLDCVMAIVPGILTYQTEGGPEMFVAVDQGVLIKAGLSVSISVRRAIAGVDLKQLRQSVEQEFLTIDDDDKAARQVTAKLETGFLRQFAEFRNE